MDSDDSFFSLEEDEVLFQRIDSDLDLAFALSLQEDFKEEATQEAVKTVTQEAVKTVVPMASPTKPLGIVDPQWELIDPNPDIHGLFIQFNDKFFYGKLGSVEVKWSPRMTLCAGVCCYQGRGGLCSVRLSLPLLKLRPRRDLVETLLHEMIHAYLFVTANNKDHDAHGPEFCSHMYRINKESGTRITVYHSFHDEVDFQRKHWWKCNGPCQNKRPFYGIVKRAMNRAPGPTDNWWGQHMSTCGGTFTKIKEPENYKQKNQKRKQVQETKEQKSSVNIKNFFQTQTSKSDSFNSSTSAKRQKGEVDIHTIKSIFEKEPNMVSPRSIDSDVSPPPSQIPSKIPVPFSGRGFTLGSASSYTPTSLLSKIRKELGHPSSQNKQQSSQEDAICNSILSVTPSNANKNSEVSREILSHQAVSPNSSTKVEKNRFKQSSLDKFVNSPSRSLVKFSELVGMSNENQEHRSSSSTVACPVCSNFFSDLEINGHLDLCLLTAT